MLEARTALAKYIGDTPWVDANKDNPAALQRAEELVRTGLKGAAITHTRNGAGGASSRPTQTSDPKEQLRLTNYALQEYKLAALGWLGYLKQDENAPDAYKSRYFYADALHNQVRLEVALHKFDARQYPEPSSQEIATAIKAAVDVRDSDEDDQFIDNAGLFVVDLADVDRDLAFQRWKDSSGTQGVEPRKEPKLEGPDGVKKVVVDDIPDVIQKSMQARDEYVQRVPPERDKQSRARGLRLLRGRPVLPVRPLQGGAAALPGDVRAALRQGARRLRGVEAPARHERSRATTPRGLAAARRRPRRTRQDVRRRSARPSRSPRARRGDFTKNVLSQRARSRTPTRPSRRRRPRPPGPQKDALWRKAGKMYEDALRAAPGHKDAPAAAINSAFCYKQVGEFNKAIDLYQLFISNYGSEDILDRLEHGGRRPATKKKVGPESRAVQGAHQVPRDGVRRPVDDVLRLLRLPARGRVVREDRERTRASTTRGASNAAHIGMVLYSNLGDRSEHDARCTTSSSTRRCTSRPRSAPRPTT